MQEEKKAYGSRVFGGDGEVLGYGDFGGEKGYLVAVKGKLEILQLNKLEWWCDGPFVSPTGHYGRVEVKTSTWLKSLIKYILTFGKSKPRLPRSAHGILGEEDDRITVWMGSDRNKLRIPLSSVRMKSQGDELTPSIEKYLFVEGYTFPDAKKDEDSAKREARKEKGKKK